MSATDLYDAIVEAGIEHDHHASDLYIIDTPTTRDMCRDRGWRFNSFVGTDGRTWLDVPFGYSPHWRKRS